MIRLMWNYIMNILRQIDLEDKAEQRRNQEQLDVF